MLKFLRVHAAAKALNLKYVGKPTIWERNRNCRYICTPCNQIASKGKDKKTGRLRFYCSACYKILGPVSGPANNIFHYNKPHSEFAKYRWRFFQLNPNPELN